MLMGFSNTMIPNYPTPLIEIAFRDYKLMKEHIPIYWIKNSFLLLKILN